MGMKLAKPDNPMFTSRALVRLIWPLLIEQVLAVTVGMLDVMMISSCGEAAVSGVSLVDMINVLIINVFAALATGGAVVTSQFIGMKKQEDACRSANQLLLSSFSLAALIALLTIVLRGPLIRLFFGSIEQDVMDACLIYLLITAISFPFLALYNGCAALFRSMGNSKISMIISLWMNLINLAGNAITIFWLNMGVAGAALSTLLSRMVAAVAMMILIRNPANPVHVQSFRFRLDLPIIKKILGIGVPNGLENCLFQLGRVLVVSIIAGFGTVQIAANAVANNLDSMGCIPGQAINLAIITVVGQCIGAGDYYQARYYTRKMLQICYVCMIAVNSVILLTMPWVLQIYNLSGETLRLAAILVLIHDGFAMVMWPISFCLPNALRAANDVRYTMWVAILSMWIFRIGGSFVLGQWMGWGAIGVWIAMVLDWICRIICFLSRWVGGKWQSHKI